MKKALLTVLLTMTSLLLIWCWTQLKETPPSVNSDLKTEIDTVTDIVEETITPSWNVEIMLKDKLDGILSEYCLDIAWWNQNVDPNNGLQVHTCYSYKGELWTDQVFDATTFANNSLFMPIYDVCVSLDSLEAWSEVSLSACGDSASAIQFSGNWTISPVDAPDLCFR